MTTGAMEDDTKKKLKGLEIKNVIGVLANELVDDAMNEQISCVLSVMSDGNPPVGFALAFLFTEA